MNNKIWRIDSDNLAAYTEDVTVMAKIKRSYSDFHVMAEYFRFGKLIAIQYRVPEARKRSVKRLLNCQVSV
ncbi:hypothetical protein DX902_24345 [Paenibacillus jamilae]|uniref:hypothetical protein n=1 Tax=Paenibacillus jamilae TaxID=114136 RepID=UPI000E3E9E54|nr:hypothetical protein [Paenibacillus jamilae]RFT92333.1 hypothetical protein DX902_24345 [Paenibacillus jamilae]